MWSSGTGPHGRREHDRLAIVLLIGSVLLLGCLQGCPRNQTATAVEQAGAAPGCDRSLGGDLETARRRLESARPEEAALYIQGLAQCPETRDSKAYLLLAMDVFEELGRLNEAWNSLRQALQLSSDNANIDPAFHERTEEFEGRYVFLATPQDVRRPPQVSYAGPMLDEAIQGQLADIENRRGTWRRDGRYGYWMYPGRYRVDGVELTLRPGQDLEAPGGGRGRRQ